MGTKPIPKSKRSAQSLLIGEIFRHFGGATNLSRQAAKRLNFPIDVQNFFNWRKRGKVPIEVAVPLARMLKVSPYALNYEDACQMNLKNPNPTWKEVVASCDWIGKPLMKDITNHQVAA